MRNAVKIEFRKLMRMRGFWLALIIGIGICELQAFDNFLFVHEVNVSAAHMTHPHGYDSISLLIRWMGADDYTPFGSCFFLLLPLLSAIPMGTSYYNERKSGYMMQAVTRAGNKIYIAAKIVVTFASGIISIAVPLLVNLITNALVCPLSKVRILSLLSTVAQGSFCSRLFYSHPLAYILAAWLLTSIWGGICALCAMAFAMYMKNTIIILLSPLVLVNILNFVAVYGKRFFRFTNYELSPVNLMYAACQNPNPTWFVIMYISIFLGALVLICWKRGISRECI